MTLSLAYNDDLGRVQITASGLPDIGAVRVERSVNGLLWTTVRGASALTVEDGSASVDDYEFVADQENHYRVVAPDDSPAHTCPGVQGHTSTPDTGQLAITNDAEVRCADLVSGNRLPVAGFVADRYERPFVPATGVVYRGAPVVGECTAVE